MLHKGTKLGLERQSPCITWWSLPFECAFVKTSVRIQSEVNVTCSMARRGRELPRSKVSTTLQTPKAPNFGFVLESSICSSHRHEKVTITQALRGYYKHKLSMARYSYFDYRSEGKFFYLLAYSKKSKTFAIATVFRISNLCPARPSSAKRYVFVGDGNDVEKCIPFGDFIETNSNATIDDTCTEDASESECNVTCVAGIHLAIEANKAYKCSEPESGGRPEWAPKTNQVAECTARKNGEGALSVFHLSSNQRFFFAKNSQM